MDLLSIFGLALKVSIMVLAFNLGLNYNLQEKMYLIHKRKTILFSLFSMLVIMPIVAVALSKIFDLPPMTKMVLIAMSVSPIPATLPQQEIKVGGESDYAYTLLFSAVFLSIFTIPFSISIIDNFFDQTVNVSPFELLKVLTMTIFVPFAAGFFLRLINRTFTEKLKAPLIKSASALLNISLVGIFFVAWKNIISVLNSFTLLAIVLYCLIAVITGHLLGGTLREQRTVLVFSTLSRHPGIAIAISSILFPNDIGIKSRILIFIVVSIIISKLYLAWSDRHYSVKKRKLRHTPEFS